VVTGDDRATTSVGLTQRDGSVLARLVRRDPLPDEELG
jgi:hypothetical protein